MLQHATHRSHSIQFQLHAMSRIHKLKKTGSKFMNPYKARKMREVWSES